MTLMDLLRTGPIVVNIGVRDFADDLLRENASVVHVAWRPPRTQDAQLDRILQQLL